RANVREADLTLANLRQADLIETDFSNAKGVSGK
ncbi:MAG: pentapeptide repeat-containing protein, partial [Halobacteriota archaeon]